MLQLFDNNLTNRKMMIPLNENKKKKKQVMSSYYYNKIKNESKDVFYDNDNIQKNRRTKCKSKIVKNITNHNISTNNSNLYENLYYYPEHNSKYSYSNNISSEVSLLYNDFNFNKAPSLSQNRSAIRNIIKTNKKHKIHYLNNLFCSSMCRNKLNNSNSVDDFFNGGLFMNKNLKQERNNSCIEFVPNKRKKYFNSFLFHSIANMKKISNKNLSNRNMSSGFISTGYKTIDTSKCNSKKIMSKDSLHLPMISSKLNNKTVFSSRKNNKEKEKHNDINISNDNICTYNTIFNDNSKSQFLTNLNTQKIRFALNECIFHSRNQKIKLNEFVLKMLQIKIFQGVQKARINTIFNREVCEAQKYIKKIEKIYEKSSVIYKKYNHDFIEYMSFLNEMIIKYNRELKSFVNI